MVKVIKSNKKLKANWKIHKEIDSKKSGSGFILVLGGRVSFLLWEFLSSNNMVVVLILWRPWSSIAFHDSRCIEHVLTEGLKVVKGPAEDGGLASSPAGLLKPHEITQNEFWKAAILVVPEGDLRVDGDVRTHDLGDGAGHDIGDSFPDFGRHWQEAWDVPLRYISAWRLKVQLLLSPNRVRLLNGSVL